ncbi:tripartite tricarboxylate transporter substrate-binding protein [Piscinibacter sp. XHJ-5]|uniref:tripartite tricarboxylate transporter substrate-binding protein n=1 Tax=Piscinibacter sp. XHJ-5 TaxID=3037797 RepID=UPI002452F29F|nr:tripartite tricarboxylate transporter substrate-binding protein [Piscinibacter sp. XHJ-5]
MKRLFAAIALAAAAAASFAQGTSTSPAQGYPGKPITLVVPFAAGGPTDVVARALGQAMTRTLGQAIVIENKLGAGGTLAAGYVAKAAPDGYTLLIHHNGMSTAPALYRKLAYNPLTDFEYVTQVVDVPMTLLGRKDLPAKDLQELIAYLKANAAKVNLAHAGLGAVSHLCGMVFRQAIGVELQTVPYQGTAPAMNALLGGQVDLLCDQTTQTTQHIKAGSVKLYGVTTRERIKALPDAPTLQEQGLRNFEVVVWHGVYAPKGTPKEVIDKVNAAVRAALKDPTVIQRMSELGGEIVPESKQTPEALRGWLKTEVDRWGPVIRAAGVYAD